MITNFKIFEEFAIFTDSEKSNVAVKILHIISQIRMFHWQTEKMSHHESFDEFLKEFNELSDELVEVIQGKYGRIVIDDDTYVPVRNIKELEPYKFVDQCIEVFGIYQNKVFKEDKEISALIDEIIALLQKLKYLLTLE